MKNPIESIVNFIDGLSTIGRTVFLPKNPADLIEPYAIYDKNTIFCKNNSALVTVIKFEGFYGVVGEHELEENVSLISEAIQNLFSKRFHVVKFFFENDPDKSSHVIDSYLKDTISHANNIGLSKLTEFIQDKANVTSKKSTFETGYIAIYTTHIQADGKDGLGQFDFIDKSVQPLFQCGVTATAHNDAIDAFILHLNKKFSLEALSAQHSLELMFSKLNGVNENSNNPFDTYDGRTDETKFVSLSRVLKSKINPVVQEKTLKRFIQSDSKGHELILPPTLDKQLLLASPSVDDNGFVSHHNRTYYSMQCQSVGIVRNDFDVFVSKTRDIPYRIAFTITPDGLQMPVIKSLVLSLFGSINDKAKLAKSAFNSLAAQGNIKTICKLSICITTWEDHVVEFDKDLGKTVVKLSKIQQNIQRLISSGLTWAGAKFGDIAADPLEAFYATIPGLVSSHSGKIGSAPLDTMAGIVAMLPISRQTSPWNSGSLILKTVEGKPFPLAQTTELLNAVLVTITGGTGYGKSSAIAALNLAYLLQPSSSPDLPQLRGIDFGASQQGVIEAVSQSLPSSLRHKVVYDVIRNEASKSINIHDLPLGLMHPSPDHLSFLSKFIVFMCSGLVGVYSNLEGLSKALVIAAYDNFADIEGNPNAKRYRKGQDHVLDQFFNDSGIEAVDNVSTWYSLAQQILFLDDNFKYDHLAIRAQRYAVPTFEDYQSIAAQPVIRSEYSELVDGVPICNLVARSLREALETLPIMRSYTKLDIDSAPIFYADMAEIFPSASDVEPAPESLAIYMALSRKMIETFFVNASTLNNFPLAFRRYHENRLNKISGSPKRLSADEIQRLSANKFALSIFDLIVSEGRKFGVSIVLGSQQIKAFTQSVVTLSSMNIFCGGVNVKEIQALESNFELGKTAVESIMKIKAPGRNGANIFLRANLKSLGYTTFNLINIESPLMLCLIATDNQDKLIRYLLLRSTNDPMSAWRAYSEEFPSGSTLDRVKIVKDRIAKGDYPQGVDNPISIIVDEIVDKYGLKI